MKIRPIINEQNFTKICKVNNFVIRGKHSQSKTGLGTQKNIKPNQSESTDQTIKNVEDCLVAIDHYIKQDNSLKKEIAEKIKKLLLLFSQIILQRSQNKKGAKLEKTDDDFQLKKVASLNSEWIKEVNKQNQMFLTQNITKKSHKKINRQNNQEIKLTQEIKFDKRQLESALLISEQKNKNIAQELQIVQNELKKQKQIHSEVKELVQKEFYQKIKSAKETQMKLRQNCYIFQQKCSEEQEKCKVLKKQLQYRQVQIINLWQLMAAQPSNRHI